jgi:diguanylate cyclase (GGDEF)-like protein/PAS domain S-box-containing protein
MAEAPGTLTVPGIAARRQLGYAALVGAISLTFVLMRHSTWVSNDEFHTLLETIATVLAFVTGGLALVRYYSEKKAMFLFIGLGFVATGLLDGYHAMVSSAAFLQSFSGAPFTRISWSWVASRTFLSLLLWLSLLFWRREQRLGAPGKVSEAFVYAFVGALALACAALVKLLPMPPLYQQGSLIARPQDLLAALLFLLALAGYLRKGQWKLDYFEHWLVLCLLTSFMGQALFMPLSRELYDPMFNMAHALKALSYLCAMVGLLFNMHHLYKESLARQELQFKNTILATQQEMSRDAILVVNEQGRIISYNQRFIAMWSLDPGVVARGDDEAVLLQVVARMTDPQASLERVRFLYAHKGEKSSDELPLKDGRIIDRYSSPMIGKDGDYYGRVWYFRDITERRLQERKVQDERAFSDKLIASLPGTFSVFDASGKYVRWNARQTELLGLSDEQMAAANAFDVIPPADRPYISQQIRHTLEQGSTTIETHVTGPRGPREYSFSTMRVETSHGVFIIAVGNDISARKQGERDVLKLQELLREQSIHDPLTGLYNRRFLDETMGRELIRGRRTGHDIGVVMCDIDFFKKVNDTWGHQAGDDVLKALARLLERHARGSDVVCRYGGEEFVMLLADIPPNLAYQRAEQVRGALEALRVPFGDATIQVTASFGVANFPEDGDTQDALIHAADTAMYSAKMAGRNRVMLATAQETPHANHQP